MIQYLPPTNTTMISSISSITSVSNASHARSLPSRALALSKVSLVHTHQPQQIRHFSRYRRDDSLSFKFDTSRRYQRCKTDVFARLMSYTKKLNVSMWEGSLDAMNRSWFPSCTKSESANSDFVVDPITNRRVPRKSSKDSPFVTTTETEEAFHRQVKLLAQRLAHDPRIIHPDGAPPADELDKYRKVDIGIPSYNEELIHRVNDLPQKRPQGVPPEPPRPATKAPEPPTEYTDLDEYKKVEINYPPSMNEELIHRVEDLPSKPVADGFPGQEPQKVKDSKQPYEDLHKYKPFMNAEDMSNLKSEGITARSWPSCVPNIEQNVNAVSLNSRGFNTSLNASYRKQRRCMAQLFSAKSKPQPIHDYDPYSKKPTGLELSWNKECIEDSNANKMYIRHYSPDGTASEPMIMSSRSMEQAAFPPETATVQTKNFAQVTQQNTEAKATRYKILAYDPTTQTISIAETTSAIPDSATPLSPAEVMVRLTNPTRFFPHFQPLQEEGFEIVSGGGDVLVFRQIKKVADAMPNRDVNPIDMMGRSVVPEVGNFASPTGYFSPYDYTVDEEDILRRPENVAGQTETDPYTGETMKPKGRGFLRKTATGVAWFAGTAYGIGVISEFFSKDSTGSKPTRPDL